MICEDLRILIDDRKMFIRALIFFFFEFWNSNGLYKGIISFFAFKENKTVQAMPTKL